MNSSGPPSSALDRAAPGGLPPPATETTPGRKSVWKRLKAGALSPGGTAKSRPSLLVCLLLGLFSAGILLSVPPRPFQALDWNLFDLRLRWRNALIPQRISPRILVIGIDERDYYIYDSEIHTRWIYAKLLEQLRQYGVEAVAFDVMFLNPRANDDLFANDLRDLPTFLAVAFRSKTLGREPTGPPPPGVESLRDEVERVRSPQEAWSAIERLRDYKEALEQTRSTLLRHPEEAGLQLEELTVRMAWVRYLIDAYLEAYYVAAFGRPFEEGQRGNPHDMVGGTVLLPSPPLLRSARAAGFINVEKGEEEVLRRVPLVYAYRNRLFPSMDLQVVLFHYGAKFDECKIRFGGCIEFPVRQNGSGRRQIPINARGEYLVNFRQGDEYLRRRSNRTLSFYTHPQYEHDRSQVDLRSILAGSVVLVGDTAQGSTDVQPIPLQPLFPLVGVHANVIDNILRTDYLRPTPPWMEAVLAVGLGALLGLLFGTRDSREATRIAGGVVLVYLLGQFALFLYAGNLVLPITRVVATAAAGYVVLALYTVGVIERDRRLVKEVFLKSVSPRIGEEILRRFNDPSLWASRREISVLFVDIRGFTPLSERLRPDQLVDLLEAYYDTVSEIVFRHDGQVNKFIGDAVMALYGALPGEAANHAERAVRTAVDIHLAVTSLNARLRSAGEDTPIRVGVGVNTGDVVVGTVGRRKIRIEYTALGDTVNTAERLQGQAGAGQTYIGQDTVAALRAEAPHLADKAFRFHRVEGLTLRGKTRTVDVYAVEFNAESWAEAQNSPAEAYV